MVTLFASHVVRGSMVCAIVLFCMFIGYALHETEERMPQIITYFAIVTVATIASISIIIIETMP